jgi:Zinc finger, C3HC4 type (RING finger)
MEELMRLNSKEELRNCTLTISSFEDLEAIKTFMINKEKLECMICYGMENEMFSSKCGHVACLECWKKWLKLQLVCPKCKARVRERTLFKVYSR